MNIEFQETALYDTEQHQEAMRFHRPLTFGAKTMLDYVLPPETEIQQPTEYGERSYLAEWVMPDSDGWALWSPPTLQAASPTMYCRVVLSVPSGDGWEPYDDGADLDTDSYVVATE